jgi:hypothetical protein
LGAYIIHHFEEEHITMIQNFRICNEFL